MISSPRRVVIILDVEVLHSAADIPGVIGAPVAYNEGKFLKHNLKSIFFLSECLPAYRHDCLSWYGHNDPN